jgi:hypothetical protein
MENLIDNIEWIKKFRERMNVHRSHNEAAKRRNDLHKAITKLVNKGADPRAEGTALDLYALWGDPLDLARESYLRSAIKELSETDGHVLMSSASLMTVIMGALSDQQDGRTVWCLEQNTHWTNVIRSWLTEYAIRKTYVISAPSVVKGGMVRYKVGTSHLPKNLGLILCDGTGASPGSALATLLSISPHLSERFTILARGIRVDEDGPLLKRWAAKNNSTFVVVNGRDGFIKIARRAEQRKQQGPVKYDVEGIVDEERHQLKLSETA